MADSWTLSELETLRPDVPWREPYPVTFAPDARTKSGDPIGGTYYICRICSVNHTGNDTLHADPEDVRKHVRETHMS